MQLVASLPKPPPLTRAARTVGEIVDKTLVVFANAVSGHDLQMALPICIESFDSTKWKVKLAAISLVSKLAERPGLGPSSPLPLHPHNRTPSLLAAPPPLLAVANPPSSLHACAPWSEMRINLNLVNLDTICWREYHELP